jgi:hypothetical protein
VYRFYVLRGDMLAFYVNDLTERLSKSSEAVEWEVGIELTVYSTLTMFFTGCRSHLTLPYVNSGSASS